nr:hypothetical protein [Tanacetum cinerariifolium]
MVDLSKSSVIGFILLEISGYIHSFVLGSVIEPFTSVAEVPLASALQVLRRLGSIFTSVYAAVQKLKKDSWLELQFSLAINFKLNDFQDSPDDEDDTRSSQEYLNDLEKEYQARAFLAKSKRFFKKGTQRFSSTKATDQTKCHKCGKKGHFARDCWSKTSFSTYMSPFQSKPLISPQHKPKLRPIKDFEAKYNKFKAKLALLSSSASAFKASVIKKKCLIAEAYEWDEEEMSSDDNEMVEVKVLMALAEENNIVGKESAKNDEWVKISVRKPNHDTGRILPAESQRNTTNPSVAFTDSSVTDYDSIDESSVCSTLIPPLKKLEGVESISGPKTIKLILKSKSTLKAEALKGVIKNEPSSALVKGNKSSSASKVYSTPAGKLKIVKIKDDHSLDIVIKELNSLKLQVSKNRSSYPQKHISLEREINPRNPQHAFKRCEACGSSNHTTTDHYDIEWFKRGEALQAKKTEALKSTSSESSNANRSKTPTKRWISKQN